jgi:hypothetical protein
VELGSGGEEGDSQSGMDSLDAALEGLRQSELQEDEEEVAGVCACMLVVSWADMCLGQ